MFPRARAWWRYAAPSTRLWQSLLRCVIPTAQAIGRLLESLDSETQVVIVLRETAQYLSDEGIYASAVNPKLIEDYGTGNALRHVKIAKADTK